MFASLCIAAQLMRTLHNPELEPVFGNKAKEKPQICGQEFTNVKFKC